MQRVVEHVVPAAVEGHGPYVGVPLVGAERVGERTHRVLGAVQGQHGNPYEIQARLGQVGGRVQCPAPEARVVREACLVGGAGGACLDLRLPTPGRPGGGGQTGQDQRVDPRSLLGGEPGGVQGTRVRADQHLRAGQGLVGEELGRLVEHGRIGDRVTEGTYAIGVEGETAAEPLVHTTVLAPAGQHDQRAAGRETFGLVP